MKITWITEKHPPDKGGMAVSSERITDHLRKFGVSLNILHLSRNSLNETGKNREKETVILRNFHGTKIRGFNTPFEPEKIFWDHYYTLSNSHIAGFGGDLSGYYATLWAKWTGKKSIVFFRGNDFEKVIHDSKRGWLVHFVLENADLVFTVTGEMKKRIDCLRKKRTVFLPNGIDANEWKIFDSERDEIAALRKEAGLKEKKIIGLFGHLKTKKGLDFTINLFTYPQIRENFSLLTVGVLPEEIQSLLEVKLQGLYAHFPFQKREDLPKYYSLADLVFIPSYFDGMPNVLLEAMAMGKIVLGSKAGGMADVIRDNDTGYLFDIHSPDKYESCINKIESFLQLRDDQKEKMQTKAKDYIIQNHNPEKEAQTIISLLKEISHGS